MHHENPLSPTSLGIDGGRAPAGPVAGSPRTGAADAGSRTRAAEPLSAGGILGVPMLGSGQFGTGGAESGSPGTGNPGTGNSGTGNSGTGNSGTKTQPVSDTDAESRLARRYKVLVHNDEVTPMDFVVRVLTGVFRLGVEHAIEVMLEAHRTECALVRTFGLEEAEFRVEHSHRLARSQSFPLTFSIEAE